MYLESYMIGCNDLNLMDKNGAIFEENIWKERLPSVAVTDFRAGVGESALPIRQYPQLLSG